jgi:chromate transporter
VVTEHHWLNDKQFVDAVAVAMITPGPVVITVGFIGYLVAGLPGACVAALGTFLPCYLFTVLPAPYFKKYGKLPGVVAFVNGITAAAVGAITGSVIVIAKRSLIDVPTVLLALGTVLLLLRFKKLQEPVIVVGAAAIGLLLSPYCITEKHGDNLADGREKVKKHQKVLCVVAFGISAGMASAARCLVQMSCVRRYPGR